MQVSDQIQWSMDASQRMKLYHLCVMAFAKHYQFISGALLLLHHVSLALFIR